MLFLVIVKKSALFIKLKNAGNCKLRHRDAINTLGVMDFYPMFFDIVHRYAVKTRAGQLDKAKILEFFNVPQPVPQRYVAKDIHKWQLYGNK